MAEVLTSYTNSENERVTIERITDGQFDGQYMLCIHDDYPSKAFAPMLLDDGTRRWLVREVLYLGHDGSTFVEQFVDRVLARYLTGDLVSTNGLADRGDLASDLADLYRALMQAQGLTP